MPGALEVPAAAGTIAPAKPAREPKKRRKLLWAVTVGAVAVIAVIAGVAVTVLKHNGPGTPAYGMIPTGSTPQADGRQVASAFVKAWETGNLTTAANLTNPPSAARAGLGSFAKDLGLGKMAATTGSVTERPVHRGAAPRDSSRSRRASVAARTAASALRGTGSYTVLAGVYQQANRRSGSSLAARRGRAQPHPATRWRPSRSPRRSAWSPMPAARA